MNVFDETIMTFLGDLTQRSEWFDQLMLRLKANQLIKGGAVVSVLWWLWFSEKKDSREARHNVIERSVMRKISGQVDTT